MPDAEVPAPPEQIAAHLRTFTRREFFDEVRKTLLGGTAVAVGYSLTHKRLESLANLDSTGGESLVLPAVNQTALELLALTQSDYLPQDPSRFICVHDTLGGGEITTILDTTPLGRPYERKFTYTISPGMYYLEFNSEDEKVIFVEKKTVTPLYLFRLNITEYPSLRRILANDIRASQLFSEDSLKVVQIGVNLTINLESKSQAVPQMSWLLHIKRYDQDEIVILDLVQLPKSDASSNKLDLIWKIFLSKHPIPPSAHINLSDWGEPSAYESYITAVVAGDKMRADQIMQGLSPMECPPAVASGFISELGKILDATKNNVDVLLLNPQDIHRFVQEQ